MAGGGHVSANLGRFLKGVDFPANQTDLVEHAKENGADRGVLEVPSIRKHRRCDGGVRQRFSMTTPIAPR